MRAGGVGALLGAFLALGCTTELAQVASRGPLEPLDCAGEGGLRRPDERVFGATPNAVSALVGGDYGSGDGPGLHVVARDAFRVLLNGELVVESSAPREGTFVPLTLLPGDNVVAVVVSAASGTPAALLSLEGLDGSTVSDAAWKVSDAPAPDYARPEADDAGWEDATDYGAPGVLAGCDRARSFPTDSAAHWIGPAEGGGQTVVLRRRISVAAAGFAQGTTGGGGAPPTLVSTFEDFDDLASDAETPTVIVLAEGVHDFRDAPRAQEVCATACSENASKTRYDVLGPEETCGGELVLRTRSDRRVLVGSNKTIVGLGRGAAVRGISLDFTSKQNVILRNVALYDVNHDLFEAGDAMTLSGAKRVWVDHVTTKWISDDFASVGAGSGDVTFSWVHFDGVTDTSCRGFHTFAASVDASTVTFDHCFFDHVESHSPRVDNPGAQVHLVNSLFADNAGYAVGAVCEGQALLEGNTFQRVVVPTQRSACSDDTRPGRILAPAGSNAYRDDVGEHRGGDGTEPRDDVFDPPYVITPETDPDRWLTLLSQAGTGGPWRLALSLEP